MKLRTLVVDDEPLARERLVDLISGEPDLELVGECINGNEAIAAIHSLRPGLVFLDVQMPERDGFATLAEIPPEEMPAIIFVTAYDQFALKAFEVHAVDYLLKPFDRERFQTAVRRARERIQARSTQPQELNTQISALLASLQSPAAAFDRIAIKSGGAVIFVKLEELDWIEAADNYVQIHAGPNVYLHRETLTALAEKLPPRKFLRISRSTLVNLDRIKELQALSHGDYSVILNDRTKLTLSRTYRDALQQLLGKLP